VSPLEESLKFDCIFNFNILWWSHLADERQSWTPAHNYIFSPSNDNKSVFIFKCVSGEGVSTNSTVQKHDGQGTNKKHRIFSPRRRAKSTGLTLRLFGDQKLGAMSTAFHGLAAPLSRAWWWSGALCWWNTYTSSMIFQLTAVKVASLGIMHRRLWRLPPRWPGAATQNLDRKAGTIRELIAGLTV